MFAATSKRGTGYIYRCNRNDRSCPGVWRVRSAVEAAVRDALEPYAADLHSAAADAVRSLPAPDRDDGANQDADKKLAAAQQGLANLARAVADGSLSLDEVAAVKADLTRQRDEATVALAAVNRPSAPPALVVRQLRDQWDELPVATLREIVSALIERVEVLPGKSVRVVHRFPVPTR